MRKGLFWVLDTVQSLGTSNSGGPNYSRLAGGLLGLKRGKGWQTKGALPAGYWLLLLQWMGSYGVGELF